MILSMEKLNKLIQEKFNSMSTSSVIQSVVIDISPQFRINSSF